MLLRDSRLFLRSLLYVIIIGCLLSGGALVALNIVMHSESGGKPLKVVVVNQDKNEALSQLVLDVIAGNSNIAAAMDVSFMQTEEEASLEVRNGAAAAMIIPEHFFASVYYGENLPCRIILNKSNESSAATISYFASIGADMLNAAQTAIYEGDMFLVQAGADDAARSAFNAELNNRMINEAAQAANLYFTIENIGYTTAGLSKTGHYAAVIMAFFFGILSLCFFHLYHDDAGHGIMTRLISAGVSKPRFVIWKILLPAFLFSLMLVISLVIGKGFIPLNLSPLSVFQAMTAPFFAAAFCGLFGIAFGNLSGPFLFGIFFVSMFFCGGIIPYSNLSETALAVGRITPVGVIYQLLSPVLGGSAGFAPYCIGAVYIILGIAAANLALDRVLLGKETA